MNGITADPNNPFQLDFLINLGDTSLQGPGLQAESQKLVNYFFAALTVPEDQMWVNLSPYEGQRIVSDDLKATELGRDMLAQDYILKQLTATLLSPNHTIGKTYWKALSERAKASFGNTHVPTQAFHKIWIMPDQASVYVKGTSAFVTDAHLKVYLEEDAVSLLRHGITKPTPALAEEAKALLRAILLPEVEREVNTAKNFANLRQIYSAMILAAWFKKRLKQSILGENFVDQAKTDGLRLPEKDVAEQIYQQYVAAYKKGVYNQIREEFDPMTRQTIPKRFFSGGENFGMLSKNLSEVSTVPQRFAVPLARQKYIRAEVRIDYQQSGAASNSSMTSPRTPAWPRKTPAVDKNFDKRFFDMSRNQSVFLEIQLMSRQFRFVSRELILRLQSVVQEMASPVPGLYEKVGRRAQQEFGLPKTNWSEDIWINYMRRMFFFPQLLFICFQRMDCGS